MKIYVNIQDFPNFGEKISIKEKRQISVSVKDFPVPPARELQGKKTWQ